MGYDASAITAAETRYHEAIAASERDLQARKVSLYEKNPRLREIAERMATSAIRAVVASMDEGGRFDSIMSENLALQEERSRILASLGYPPDWLTDKTGCQLCGSSGFLSGGEMCECLKPYYAQELQNKLRRSLGGNLPSFARFDLSGYSSARDPANGVSPLENIRYVKNECENYASELKPGGGRNLLLNGPPGVGKTYLAACIAVKAVQNLRSTEYISACELSRQFENERFSKDPEDTLSPHSSVCDLLIIDDLGSENSTSYTASRLYALINERLLCRENMIVCTSLNNSELSKRYSPAFASRIAGDFKTLFLYGEDFRKNKRRYL